MHFATVPTLDRLVAVANRRWEKMSVMTYRECRSTFIEREMARLLHDRKSCGDGDSARRWYRQVVTLLADPSMREAFPDLAISKFDSTETDSAREFLLGRFEILSTRLLK
jgi:hypothetical protein